MSHGATGLLSPDFLAKIEQLDLVSRKIVSGRMRGERRSKRRGFSTEFADHRGYVVGDDWRFLDWNILIRLDRLFIKLFEEEEDLHFHLLIDTSRSMDFGNPTKLLFAKRVAAALAYVALVNLDRVAVWTFADGLAAALSPARGRRSALRVFAQIEAIQAGAGTNLGATCQSFAYRNPSRGVVVLLSDLMDKHGFETGLRYLIARQFDVHVVHILSQEEIDPPVTGELELIDSEDEDCTEVTISAPLLARYRRNVKDFQENARDVCTRRGVSYLFTTNDVPFERLVLRTLREGGLVR